MGTDPVYADGEMGEIEREVINANNLEPLDFNIIDIKQVTSRGIRRNLLAPIYDLKWRHVPDSDQMVEGNAIEVDFKLFRGTYAVMVLT